MNLLNHNISGYLFTLFAVIVIYVLITRQINEINSKFKNINSVILSNTNSIKTDFKKDIKKYVRENVNDNITDVVRQHVTDEINNFNIGNNTNNAPSKLYNNVDNSFYNDNADDHNADDVKVDDVNADDVNADDGPDELDNDDFDESDDGLDELDNDDLDELDDDWVEETNTNTLSNNDINDVNNFVVMVSEHHNSVLCNLEKIEHVDDNNVSDTETNVYTECKIIELDETDDNAISNKIVNDVVEKTTVNEEHQVSMDTVKKENDKSLVLNDITTEQLKNTPYDKMSAPELRAIVKKFSLSSNAKNIKKKELFELVDTFVKSQ